MRRAIAIAATVLPLLTACKNEDCLGTGQPAFEVTVVDARTGTPIADSAVVYVFELPGLRLVDSVSAGYVLDTRIVTTDRRGLFTVVVERPGYYPWSAEDRKVGGDCSTETVLLTARLVRRGA
jgi:hypothetical protein